LTDAALRVLERDPDGFFLMVENEGSDTYAHRNSDREAVTAEMLGLDAAIAIALEYQERHPRTLILVTADHETGGMYLPGDTVQRLDPTEPVRPSMVLRYGTGSHTAGLVPLFAAGPGAERFGGLKDNDEVGRILKELVGGS
jgi:alkaline phosphatase